MNPEPVPQPLLDFFKVHGRIALAFSGGTDSSYLLYAAVRSGCDVTAYSVESVFRSPVERENAVSVSEMLGVRPVLLGADILSVPGVSANGPDRCYLCKKAIFAAMRKRADDDGIEDLCDATNASDDPSERPGMRALEEMGVLSPLREAGITKDDVRELSRRAGLPCWSAPSDSCLATRMSPGVEITETNLGRTAEAEAALRSIGFSGFRVRTLPDGTASLQIQESQMTLFKSNEGAVEGILAPRYGGFAVSLRE